ncbi:MAG TPA: hypothetical protein VGQ57_08185 [Polyangiaceae bacterium]|jgi:hypothetical protein|nr:hypothetical protein [Polyangiaceae bacterium]
MTHVMSPSGARPQTETPRLRYPLRAKVGVTVAFVLALAELGALGVFMAPLLPLVPVLFMIVIGNACVLSDVVQWAASLGRYEPVREPRAEAAGRPRRPPSQTAAHAA